MKVTQILRLLCIALKQLISLTSKVTEIVPNCLVMSDSDKFKYILSCNDYDIMKICVIGISEMCSERNKLLRALNTYPHVDTKKRKTQL
jgi:hypothetical protein